MNTSNCHKVWMTGSLNVWPLNPSGVRCLVDWDWVVYGSLHDPGGGSTDSRNCRRHLSCQVFFLFMSFSSRERWKKKKKKKETLWWWWWSCPWCWRGTGFTVGEKRARQHHTLTLYFTISLSLSRVCAYVHVHGHTRIHIGVALRVWTPLWHLYTNANVHISVNSTNSLINKFSFSTVPGGKSWPQFRPPHQSPWHLQILGSIDF